MLPPTDSDDRDRGRAQLAQGVAAVVCGDRTATRALLDGVAPFVVRAARRVLGWGHPDVEDVAQQALAAFVARLAHFRGECSLHHFAERIAVNQALTLHRDSLVRRRGLVDDADLNVDSIADPSQAPDEEATARELRALLRYALDEVAAPQAEALALHFLFDHTVAEIADMTGVPEETVRSRLRNGKVAMRARIQSDRRLVALKEVLT